MKSFHRILVPVDFSPHSERALVLAECLARQNDVPLILLHVVEAPGIARQLAISAPVVSNEKVMLQDAERGLHRLGERTLPEGVDWTVNVALGQPAAEIVTMAESEGVDLIVMGTLGRSAFRQLLAGSVAERVVRTAPCAVLTVKQDKE